MSVGEVSRVRRLIPVAVAAALFAACSSSPPGRPGGIAGGGGTSAGASGTGGTTGGAGHGSGGVGGSGAAGASGAAGNSGAAGTAGGPGATGSAGASGNAGTSGSAGSSSKAGASGSGGSSGGTGAGGSAGTSGGAGAGGSAGTSGGAGAGGVASTPGSTGAFVPAAGPLVLDVATASNPVTPSGRLFYEVTVSNVSAQAVSGVTLSVLLPASLQFNGATDANPDASCFNNNCAASTRPSWALGALAPGATQIVTVNAQVITSAVTDGDAIASSFTLMGTGTSLLTVNKAVQVFSKPQAQLTFGTTTNPMTPAGDVTYDIDVGQIGTVPLTGVALHVFLPPGLIVGAVSDGGTQSLSSPGEIDWAIGGIDVGKSLHRSVHVTGDGTAPAGSILPARAILGYDGTDPSPSAEFSLSVIGAPQPLILAWDVTGAPAAPTGRLLQTLTIGNVSTRSVSGVSLLLRLPAGLQFNGAGDADPDANCFNNACAPNTEVVWTVGTIAAGASVTIAINTQVIAAAAPDGTLLSSYLVLGATGLEPFNVRKTTPVYGESQARLAFGSATNPVTSTGTFTYDLDIGHTGATTLTGTALRAFIPAGLTVISMSNGGVETTPGEIDWDVGSLAVGASVHRTLQVMANGTVPAGGAFQARAILSHDGGLETDGTADYTVPLVAAAQSLLVDVGVASGPALSGGRLLYTMTVSNVSMQDVLGVSIMFPVPEGLQFNGAGDADPDGNCFNNACNSDVEATWSLGTVAAGAGVSIAVDMSVATTVVDGTLFSARPTFRATGLNPIIVTKTVAAFGEPKAQLAIGTATNPVVPGGAFAYSLDIGQIGATPLTGTTLRVFLPPGVTATTVSDGGTAASTGEVDWSLGTVAVGAAIHRSVQVTSDSSLPAGAQLAAHATLSYDGGLEVDETSDETVSAVGLTPALAVTIMATPNPTTHGTRLLYTLGITNVSARPVDGITVLLPVPATLQFNGSSDASPAAGCFNNACNPNVEAPWNLGSLGAGISQAITINTLVAQTVLSGVLIPAAFKVTATGLDAPIIIQTTVAAQ